MMASMLSIRNNGTAEMAYIGQTPWHRLGSELAEDATKEQWRVAAGFDHDIIESPVMFRDSNGVVHEMRGKRVLYRGDNLNPLSVVSSAYKIVQPAAVLDYFDELAQRGGFKLSTAGTLFGGKQYWAQALIGAESYVADPKDKILGQLLMSTSVDLSLPTELRFCSCRVVCHNTLTVANNERNRNQVRVSHRSVFDAAAVNEQLGIKLREEFAETIEMFRRLSDTSMTDLDMITATLELLQPDVIKLDQEALEKLAGTAAAQRIGQLAIEHDAIGSELSGTAGTAWGWLNAVTQYVDHEYAARTDDRRLSRAWFGDGDRMKSRAQELAVSVSDSTAEFLGLPLATKSVDALMTA